MAVNSIVRARINEEIKLEASVVLEAMGLTVSDAFRMLLIRIAHEKALPFTPLIPNAKTIKALKDSYKGNMITVGSIDNLLTDLNADN
ncbi:type II toxin-antitoxin system RelB/DinJ family antitoxin, partial [bacterium]